MLNKFCCFETLIVNGDFGFVEWLYSGIQMFWITSNQFPPTQIGIENVESDSFELE